MGVTSAAPAKKAYQASAWHLAALLAGNAALAFGPWFVRVADTGPVSAGFWRLALPIPLIAWLAWRERSGAPLDRRLLWLAAVAGVFFAVDLASWHIGIEMTRLGNAVLFGNSGSVILMFWGLVALRRKPLPREGLAVLAALSGAAILLGRSLEISPASALGDLFCLFAGLCYAFYLLPAQRARATLGAWTVLLLVCCVAAPIMLAMAFAMGEPILPGAAGWSPVVGLAVSSQLVGQGLLVFALRHFPPLVIGMALLTQPAIAACVGWFAFGEMLTVMDVAGMALLAGALVLARSAPPPKLA
ncbi:DMT family transporter [Qipengyuania sp. SM2507]